MYPGSLWEHPNGGQSDKFGPGEQVGCGEAFKFSDRQPIKPIKPIKPIGSQSSFGKHNRSIANYHEFGEFGEFGECHFGIGTYFVR